MSGIKFFSLNVFLLLLILSCERTKVLPDPPVGSVTIGTDKNEIGKDVLEMPDGNLLIVGSFGEAEQNYDAYVLRVSVGGDILEALTFGESNQSEVLHRVIPVSTGGYLLAGIVANHNGSNPRAYLLRLDESLNKAWESTISLQSTYTDAGGNTNAEGVFELPSGDFILSYANSYSPIIMKVDPSGNMLSFTTFPIQGSANTTKRFTVANSDGTFTLFLPDYQLDSGFYMYSISEDLQSTTIYEYTHDEYYPELLSANSLPNGNYLVSLYESGSGNASLVEIDSLGNRKWKTEFSSDTRFKVVLPLSQTEYFLAGSYTPYSNVPSYIEWMFADSSGSTSTATRIDGEYNDKPEAAIRLTDGRIALVSLTTSFGAGGSDILLTILNN